MRQRPALSVVIPIHNEEAILETAVRALAQRLERSPWSHEIILAENGSLDDTVAIARRLETEVPGVRLLHIGEANYGRALKAGISAARGRWTVCDEIDLCDFDFYTRAVAELESGADLVVGSKRHPDSLDGRPWIRRQGTAVINRMLNVVVGFEGTDTHGLKAARTERLLPVAGTCVVEHNLFASELAIRAARQGLRVREVPLRLREIRPPSVGLFRRVPRVLSDLARLAWVIRVRG